MKVLTQTETTHWLQQRGHVGDPHLNLDATRISEKYMHVKRYAPHAYGTFESFMDRYLNEINPNGDVLVQITVWDLWCESRGYIIKNLLPHFDETSVYRQMGAWLFQGSEHPKALAVFSLTASFGWKSYLYSEREQSVLFNWEGEIIDFWTSSVEQFQKMNMLFEQCKFPQV